MRRMTVIAAAFLFTMIAAAAPALAGYGALAHDEASGKYGLSSNEETQSKAEEVAKKICGSDSCKIVFRTAAKECGAIAMVSEAKGPNPAWGAGKHGQRGTAELAAMTNCQKHTKSQCKIRGVECNR
jgi:hypothetical protein